MISHQEIKNLVIEWGLREDIIEKDYVIDWLLSYSDTLPYSVQVRCYAFEEVFAEKLCAMGERGRPRDLYVIEPYSLRRTQEGNLVLHGVKAHTGESRSYQVDRIKSIKVTAKTFRPRYEIEFSVSGRHGYLFGCK